MTVGVAPGPTASALADLAGHAYALARQHARAVDAENRFPAEAVGAVRDAGLFGLLVPRSEGGLGGTLSDACAIARGLGEECLSTALIWAMHSQQVLIMADHGLGQWSKELRQIAGTGALVASATTERGKPGILRTAQAALEVTADGLRVDRPSPVVSYGEEADFFLVTVRADVSQPETDVRFLLLERRHGRVTGGWDAMGMRGTRSVPMLFEGTVPPRMLMSADFRRVAARSAIPAAHFAWSSAWMGAAHGAYDRFVSTLRDGGAGPRRRLSSDLFVTRLGDVQLSLDLADALLLRQLEHYETLRASGAPDAAYDEPAWTVPLNNVKVACSRLAYEAVDGLMALAGLAGGYLRDSSLGIERTLRDLRSAALMVSNDELLQINVKRLVLEAAKGSDHDGN